MTRLSQLLHLDDGEFPALRAKIEAQPLPTKLRRGVHTPLPSLPVGAPARAVATMADLRAADAPAPPAPLPMLVCDASRALALSGRFIRTQRGHYDSIATELEAALAELAELAPIAALLAEDAPDTGWGVHGEQLAEVAAR